MIFIPGLSIFFHSLVNIFCFLKRNFFQATATALFFLASSVIILGGGWIFLPDNLKSAFFSAIQDEKMSRQETICDIKKPDYSKKQAVLRLDDVQSGAYREASKIIIEGTREKNMKMVLGVIPRGFLNDLFMMDLIRENNCALELAIHGWDHSMDAGGKVFEFENADETEAEQKILEGKKILKEISGRSPVTFIPPGNKISPLAERTLVKEGITRISADGLGNPFDMTVSTFDFAKNEPVANEKILAACEDKFKKNELCVIVIHPQDYMTGQEADGKKLKQYFALLKELEKRDIQTITFSDSEW